MCRPTAPPVPIWILPCPRTREHLQSRVARVGADHGRGFVKCNAAHLAGEQVGEGSLDGAVLFVHAQIALKALQLSARAVQASEAALPLASVEAQQDVPSGEWGLKG